MVTLPPVSQSAALERLTSVQAGLHKHTDGSHTQLKVVRGDVSGVPHDEGQRLHTLDEGLGVMLAQILTHRQTVLVHQTVGLLGLEAEGGAFIGLQLLFPNLEEDRSAGRRQNRSPPLPSKTPQKPGSTRNRSENASVVPLHHETLSTN